ncbi:RNA polymerase sigma-70 factor [Streptomyces sp. NPDC049555]|uniref:RNA polymerase sigma-70 factor n=1 Tax=unclassified Streptomyces TaxID=2593676 RepID=UPI0034393A6F
MTTSETLLEAFEGHRALLTAVAYRMLGRFADAEDVVQEAWLRWSSAGREEVREPRAYLVRVTTRLALDRLRQVQARREEYVGPWLPEPVTTAYTGAERAELADSVSLALLVVLESLSPLERAVFVLREAFDLPFRDIAEATGRSEAAVRQLAGRARRHVAERRPRFDADPARGRELTERFLAAAGGGSLQDLLALLAPDVRLVADSGGRAKGPRRVIHSADKVARFLLAVAAVPLPEPDYRLVEVNGGPALLVLSRGRPDSVLCLAVAEGRISTVYLMRNPDKLSGLLPVPSAP